MRAVSERTVEIYPQRLSNGMISRWAAATRC